MLVKCANWLNHLEFDWESPVWKHMFEFLSDNFTLLRHDERGCGLSDWNCENNSFDLWVDDLERVVETNELDKFPLLGISQGASVAIEYAARHPEKVSHLILYGGFMLGRSRRGTSEYKKQQLLLSLIENGWEQRSPAFRQVFASLFVPGGSDEHQRWFAELCRKTATAENAYRIQTICSDLDVTERISELDIPTLVMHCKDDEVVPIEAGRHMAAEIPNAQFVQLDSANHLLLSDEPAWEQFCDEVLHFLNVPERKAGGIDSAKLDLLTVKEKSILALLGEGLSNSGIAEKAFLSEKTVRNHLTNIYDKLDVSTRAEAIVLFRSE